MAREHKAAPAILFSVQSRDQGQREERREGAGGKTDTKLNQSNWKIGSARYYEEIMASLGIRIMPPKNHGLNIH